METKVRRSGEPFSHGSFPRQNVHSMQRLRGGAKEVQSAKIV